jgi:hypothetical protein
MIHTSATLVPTFQQLCNEKLPVAPVFNIVESAHWSPDCPGKRQWILLTMCGPSPTLLIASEFQRAPSTAGSDAVARQDVFDALDRMHRGKRIRRRRKFLRFRLRTLILLMTAVAAFSAFVGPRQTAIMRHVEFRWQQTLSSLPTTPAADVVVLFGLFCGLLFGPAVFGFGYRLDEKRGYLLFALLSCVGLVALIIGLSLDTESLKETELQDLRADQIARFVLLWFACAVPVSAFLGWYCSRLTKRDC